MTASQSKPASVKIKKQASISLVWLIPIISVLLGAWLVYRDYSEKGPLLTITFDTAASLEAGKTKIKYKDVEIGRVVKIEIGSDLSKVIVTARMDKRTRDYINENTKFWVVKPRIGTEGVSGLSTLLSGAYIGIDASEDGKYTTEFIGLEEPPLRTANTPGVQIILEANDSGSLFAGSPVYYKKFKVGQIESIRLSEDYTGVLIDAFIESPYDNLVNRDSSFWRISGVSAQISAEGVSIQMQSLESIIFGGIEFNSPQSFNETVISDGSSYPLYDSKNEIGTQTYSKKQYFILNFDQSIRGLTVGASVEYRGLKIGQVISIRSQYDPKKDSIEIPILIEIEPERLGIDTALSPINSDFDNYEDMINAGLRAKLLIGNLLTGRLYVSLDFYEDAEPEKLVMFNNYPQIPTLSSDLDKIAQNFNDLLEKVNDLEIQKIIDNINLTLNSSRNTLDKFDNRFSSSLQKFEKTLSETQLVLNSLDENSVTRFQLNQMIKEITQAARSIRNLSDSIEKRPDSIIFGKPEQQFER